MIQTRKEQAQDAMFLVGVLLLSFGLMFYDIWLPGMFQDEAFDIDNTMQLMVYGELRSPNRAPLYLFSKAYPVMMHETMGPIYAYSIIPFYCAFGVNLIAARLMPITFGLLTLILTFLFGKTFFSRRVAYMSTALLSVFPSFIQWTRIGNFGTTILIFLTMGTLLFLFRWLTTGRTRSLLLTAFFLGLGFSSKANYYWFALDLIVLYLLFRPRIHLRPFQVACSVLAFVAGAFPFLVYNCFIDPLATLRFAFANLTRSMYGTSNLELGGNLLTRLEQFMVLLEGSAFSGVTGTHLSNPLYSVVFGMLVVGLAVALGGKLVEPVRRRRIIAMCLLLALLLLESLYTTSNVAAHHLIILMPLPQLIIAEALDALPFGRMVSFGWSFAGSSRNRKFRIGAVVVAILMVTDIAANVGYHQSLQRTGGVGLFSDAIYDLTDYLSYSGISRPIAVDWGFGQLGVLSGGKVYAYEIFGYLDWEGSADVALFEKTLQGCLTNTSNVYLFHTPAHTTSLGLGRFEVFQDTAVRMHRSVVLVKTFCQRDGVPVILVYKTI